MQTAPKEKATIITLSGGNSLSANEGIALLNVFNLQEPLHVSNVEAEGINGKGNLARIDALGGFKPVSEIGDAGETLLVTNHIATTAIGKVPDPKDPNSLYNFIFDTRNGAREEPLGVYKTTYKDGRPESTELLPIEGGTNIVPPATAEEINDIYTLVKLMGKATKTLEFQSGFTESIREKLNGNPPKTQEDYLLYTREALKHLVINDDNIKKLGEIRNELEADPRISGELLIPSKFKDPEFIKSLTDKLSSTALISLTVRTLNDIKGLNAVFNGTGNPQDVARYADLVAEMKEKGISTKVVVSETFYTNVGVDSTGNVGVFQNNSLGGMIINSALYSDKKDVGLGLKKLQDPIQDAYEKLIPKKKDAKLPAKAEMIQAEAILKAEVKKAVSTMNLSDYDRKIIYAELAKIDGKNITEAILGSKNDTEKFKNSISARQLYTLGLRATTSNVLREKGFDPSPVKDKETGFILSSARFTTSNGARLKGVNYGAEMTPKSILIREGGFGTDREKNTPIETYLHNAKLPTLEVGDFANHRMLTGIVFQALIQEANENTEKNVKIQLGNGVQNWRHRETLGVALGEIMNLDPKEDMAQESINKFNYVVRNIGEYSKRYTTNAEREKAKEENKEVKTFVPNEGLMASIVSRNQEGTLTDKQESIKKMFGVLITEIKDHVLSGTLTPEEIKDGKDASLKDIMAGVEKAKKVIESLLTDENPSNQHLGLYAKNCQAVVAKNKQNEHLMYSLLGYKEDIETVLSEPTNEAIVIKAKELAEKYDEKKAIAELKITTGALEVRKLVEGVRDALKYQMENNMPLYPTAKMPIGQSVAYDVGGKISRAMLLNPLSYQFVDGKRNQTIDNNLGLSIKTADIVKANFKDDKVEISLKGINATSFAPQIDEELMASIYDTYNENKPKRESSKQAPSAPEIEKVEGLDFGEIDFGDINEAKKEIAPEADREEEISMPEQEVREEEIPTATPEAKEEIEEVKEDDFEITVTPADEVNEALAEAQDEAPASISLLDIPLGEDEMEITLTPEVVDSEEQVTATKAKKTTKATPKKA